MADNKQNFQWLGINKQGKRVKGNLIATDMKEAQAELARQEISITNIRASYQITKGQQKVKAKHILLFTRYLSTMLSSGLPILQALDILAQDQDNAAMHSFIIALRANISEGKTLTESFSQYPQYFSGLYINLISAGEKSGALDKILKRLANYLEKTETLKNKIKKALIYPISIVCIALLVTSIMLIFVVPKFENMFKSVGAQLPLFTRIVVEMSKFMQHYWWLLLIIIFGGIWLLRYSIKKYPAVRYKVDSLTLRIWVIGPILRKGIIARYTRTLSTTLEASMPITESLTAMVNLMGNSLYSDAVSKIRDDVISGHQLSVSMASTKLFPNMVVQMIAVGEASGMLADMLNKVADYYEEEVNTVVDSLSSLLEPLIMVILGVLIGGLVIAMYLPIFKLGSMF